MRTALQQQGRSRAFAFERGPVRVSVTRSEGVCVTARVTVRVCVLARVSLPPCAFAPRCGGHLLLARGAAACTRDRARTHRCRDKPCRFPRLCLCLCLGLGLCVHPSLCLCPCPCRLHLYLCRDLCLYLCLGRCDGLCLCRPQPAGTAAGRRPPAWCYNKTTKQHSSTDNEQSATAAT